MQLNQVSYIHSVTCISLQGYIIDCKVGLRMIIILVFAAISSKSAKLSYTCILREFSEYRLLMPLLVQVKTLPTVCIWVNNALHTGVCAGSQEEQSDEDDEDV